MSLPSILECERGLAALAEAQPSGDLARAVAFGRALLHYVRNAGTPAPMPQTVKQQAQSLPLLPRGVAMHLARAPEPRAAAAPPRAQPKALPAKPVVKRSPAPPAEIAAQGLPANGLGLMVEALAGGPRVRPSRAKEHGSQPEGTETMEQLMARLNRSQPWFYQQMSEAKHGADAMPRPSQRWGQCQVWSTAAVDAWLQRRAQLQQERGTARYVNKPLGAANGAD